MLRVPAHEFAAAVEQVRRALTLPAETTARPILIALSGLPGTGKSFLARRIAAHLPCVIVESDFIRKTLIPQPTYTSEESAYIHQVAHAVIAQLLRAGHRVICDATNLAEWHRERLLLLAAQNDARAFILQTIAPEKIVKERLRRRSRARARLDHSDADFQVYLLLQREMEPIRAPHMVVDTRGNLNAALAKILRALA